MDGDADVFGCFIGSDVEGVGCARAFFGDLDLDLNYFGFDSWPITDRLELFFYLTELGERSATSDKTPDR